MPVGAPSPYNVAVYTSDAKTTTVASGITRCQGATQDLALNAIPTESFDVFLQDPQTSGLVIGQYCELLYGWTTPTLWINGYITKLDQHAQESGVYTVELEHPMSTLTHKNVLGDCEFTYPDVQSVQDILTALTASSGWAWVWVGSGSPPGLGDDWRADWDTQWNAALMVLEHYSLYSRPRAGGTRYSGVMEYGNLNDVNPTSIWGGKPLAQQLIARGYDCPPDVPNSHYAQQEGYVQITDAQMEEDAQKVGHLVWGLGHGSFKTLVTIQSLYGDVFKSDGVTLASNVTKWQPRGVGGPTYYVKPNTKVTWRGHTFEMVAQQQRDGYFAYGVVDRTGVANYGDGKDVIELLHKDHACTDPEMMLSSILGFLESATLPVDSWTMTTRWPLNDANMVPGVIAPGQQLTSVNWEGWTQNPAEYGADLQYDATNTPYRWQKFPSLADLQAKLGTSAGTEYYNNLMRIVEVQTRIAKDGMETTLTFGKAKLNKHKSDTALARLMDHHRKHSGSHKHYFVKAPFHDMLFVFSQMQASTVQAGSTTTSVKVKPGDGNTFQPGFAVTVGAQTGQITNIAGDTLTVTGLTSIAVGNGVSQNLYAKEDPSGDQCLLTPGGYMLSVVPRDNALNKHHSFHATLNLPDDTQVCDLIFGKPRYGHPTNLNIVGDLDANNNQLHYLLARIALSGSSLHCGFYITDGLTDTPVGTTLASPVLDANQRISMPADREIRVELHEDKGEYNLAVKIINPALSTNTGTSKYHIAKWADLGDGHGPTFFKTAGNIGVHLKAGSTNGYVVDMDALPESHHKTHRSNFESAVLGKHFWHNMGFYVSKYHVTTGLVQGGATVLKGTGKVADDAGLTILNDDGTQMTWTADSGWKARLGDYIVYNGSTQTIADGRGGPGVKAKHFGGVQSVDIHNPAFYACFLIGRLSNSLDGSGKPWITNASAGAVITNGPANTHATKKKHVIITPGRARGGTTPK